MKEFCNIKIWKETRRRLKIIAAQLDRPMTQVLSEIVKEKQDKLKKEKDERINRNSK